MADELKEKPMLRIRTHGGTYVVDADKCYASQDGMTLYCHKKHETVHITKDWVAVCRVGSPEDLATTQLMELPGVTSLSVRARNQLAGHGWRVLGDVVHFTDEDIRKMKLNSDLAEWLSAVVSEVKQPLPQPPEVQP